METLSKTREYDPFEPKVILLVEDDPALAEVLEAMIGMFISYRVIPASNAFQALNVMRNVLPDLFLFDYQLPGVNGLDLYQRLHARQVFANIPVLFISAVAPKDLFETQHLPYIGKPFDLDDLLQKISRLLTHGQVV